MIGWGVSILRGVENCPFPLKSQWPLTQGWRYHAACDVATWKDVALCARPMNGWYTNVDNLDHNPTVVARDVLCKHLRVDMLHLFQNQHWYPPLVVLCPHWLVCLLFHCLKCHGWDGVQTFRRQTIDRQTFRRQGSDVSTTTLWTFRRQICVNVKMTVNPVQMLALIAEATDARPLQANSFQTDLDKPWNF